MQQKSVNQQTKLFTGSGQNLRWMSCDAVRARRAGQQEIESEWAAQELFQAGKT
jgi:hypothetical protein